MSFLLSLTAIMASLQYDIRWKNDVLNIPLHDPIDHYRFLPEATLFISGMKVTDPLMYYERNGVEWTFISTVNTSVVRTYTIKYKVHFPTYSLTSTHAIQFVIVDLIPPTIMQVPSFRIPIGSKMPDLKEGLIIRDNYDPIEKLQVTIYAQEVLLTRIGKYPVRYQIKDVSGNLCEGIGHVEIYDPIPPEIIMKKSLTIGYGETFRISDFMTIRDNVDLLPDILLDDSEVDYGKIGSYPVLITVTDQSGNQTRLIETLTIIDMKPPVIVFKTMPKVIAVHTHPDRKTLLDFIFAIRDDVDPLTMDDIEILHDIQWEIVGTYAVYYTLSDQSGNTVTTKLNVVVSDLEAPRIWLTEPLVFDVFSPEPNLLSRIDVFDNYASKSSIQVKMTGSFKMQVTGLYPVTFTATDPSGNITQLFTHVEILDRIPPQVVSVNDIVITDFTRKNLLHFFHVTDQYDTQAQMTVWVDDFSVDYETIGEYWVLACAKDRALNQTCLEVPIIVADIIEPVLVLSTQVKMIGMHQDPPDLASFILKASDNYDHVDHADVLISGFYDMSVPGRYPITYTLTDTSKNTSMRTLMIIIDDRRPPSLNMDALDIVQYGIFDPLIGVECTDAEGPVTLKFFPEFIDTSKPGSVVIVYVATDARGNYVQMERKITITPAEKKHDLMAFLPMMILTGLGALSVYAIVRKMS